MAELVDHEEDKKQDDRTPPVAQGLPSRRSTPSCLSYEYRPLDLHEIVSDKDRRAKLLPVLDSLIRNQASLHHAEYFGEPETLKDNVLRRGNTFRGVLIYARDRLPMAYAVYYPMINGNGERGNYIEDAYIVESFRGNNLISMMFNEIAKRSLDEGATFLQWSTDKRNTPFQGYSNKIGAFHPNMATVVATDLLSDDFVLPVHLKDLWDQSRFVTVPIRAEDVNMMRALNVTPDIVRKTGDINFRGFITFSASDMATPVAITAGWPHMSTFRLEHGMYLEHPNFAENLSDADQSAILMSIAHSARDYARDNALSYLKWHLKKDGSLPLSILTKDFGMDVDTMVGTAESEMEVYTLRNGKLQEIAAQCFPKTVEIPTMSNIGAIPLSRVTRTAHDPAPRNG